MGALRVEPMSSGELAALPVVVTFDQACTAWGFSKRKGYILKQSGQLPFRLTPVGASTMVTKANLLASLGLPPEGAPAPQDAADAEPVQALATPDPAGPGAGYVIIAVPVAAGQLPGLLSGPLAAYVASAGRG